MPRGAILHGDADNTLTQLTDNHRFSPGQTAPPNAQTAWRRAGVMQITNRPRVSLMSVGRIIGVTSVRGGWRAIKASA